MIFGHYVRMGKQDTPGGRLRSIRKAAGYKSASAASRELRLPKDALISHENGNRNISLDAAQKYGKAFGVDPAWLIYGDRTDAERADQQMDMSEAVDRVFLQLPLPADLDDETVAAPMVVSVPLVSWVSAGNLKPSEGVTSADIERYVPVANLPRGDWIALTVSGDSMNRIAPEGSIIIVNRADDSLINDRFYIFALEGGDATFKRFRRQPRPMLQPFSTNLDHLSMPVDGDELYVIGRVRRVITDV